MRKKNAKPAIHGRSVYNLPWPTTAKQCAAKHHGTPGEEVRGDYILKQPCLFSGEKTQQSLEMLSLQCTHERLSCFRVNLAVFRWFLCCVLNLELLRHLSAVAGCLQLDSFATAAPLIKCLSQDHYFQSSNYMLVSFIDRGQLKKQG